MTRGLFAFVAIVAVVAGVIFMGLAPAHVVTPGAEPNSTVQAQKGPSEAPALFPVKIVLECETPTDVVKEPDLVIDKTPEGGLLLKAKNGTVLMQVKQRSEGQLVRYIDIPDGWIDAVFKDRKGIPGALPGKLSYEFEAPRDDTYYVYLRAKWMDSCGNSVWVKVDDGEWYNLEDEYGKIGDKNYKWAWHPLYVGGRAKPYQLKTGKHTLWLNTREDGPYLDQWVISTDASPPVGGAASNSK